MQILRSDIYENLKMALATLRANKLRSFLTVFGVVIGIITVMLIASIISGIDVSVTREVESFGTRSIYISKFNPGIHIGRMSREERMRKELTYDDAIALQQLPAVELSVPFLDITNNWFGGKLMVSGGGKTSAQVALQGTLPEFEKAGTQVISETIRTNSCASSGRKSQMISSRSDRRWPKRSRLARRSFASLECSRNANSF
jgi:putative ABC transport system permease protein